MNIFHLESDLDEFCFAGLGFKSTEWKYEDALDSIQIPSNITLIYIYIHFDHFNYYSTSRS